MTSPTSAQRPACPPIHNDGAAYRDAGDYRAHQRHVQGSHRGSGKYDSSAHQLV